jgi:glycosyltransferase involved in cell wall biosynthesis
MKRLRIAHLIQHFAEGEIEAKVAKLVLDAAAHGIESVVIAYLGDGPLRQKLEAHGVRTHLMLMAPGASARLPGRLAALLAAEGADAVHTHHVGSFVYGATAAHMLGIPALHTEHDEQLYATVRVRSAGASRALPNSIPGEHALLGGAGDLSMRSVMIANGISLRTRPTRYERAHLRAHLRLPDDAFVFGSVARWSTQGEAAQLVEAFARVVMQHPEAILLMACDGSTRTTLSACARSLGIAPHVRFVGAPEYVPTWLPAVDAFALTSMHAQPVLEAMAACVPVVCTAVGGLPSLLRNGAGAVLSGGDLVGLVQTMSAFITSPWLCDAYSTLARTRVEAEHSAQAMALAYAVLYRAACATRAAAPVESVGCSAIN